MACQVTQQPTASLLLLPMSQRPCFVCHKTGHKAAQCPQLKQGVNAVDKDEQWNLMLEEETITANNRFSSLEVSSYDDSAESRASNVSNTDQSILP